MANNNFYGNQAQAQAQDVRGIGPAPEPAAEIEREMSRLGQTSNILENNVMRLRERIEAFCHQSGIPSGEVCAKEPDPNTAFGNRLRSIDNNLNDSIRMLNSILDRLAID